MLPTGTAAGGGKLSESVFSIDSEYSEEAEKVVHFGYESLRSAQQLGRESVQKVHFLMILSILKRLRK